MYSLVAVGSDGVNGANSHSRFSSLYTDGLPSIVSSHSLPEITIGTSNCANANTGTPTTWWNQTIDSARNSCRTGRGTCRNGLS